MALSPSYAEKIKPASAYQRLAGSLTAGGLVKFAVLSVCSVLVARQGQDLISQLLLQISECIDKLRHRPVSTHTHFQFNKTLLYPSLTFCREPPYKYSHLQRHGLYAHPRYTSTWRDFDFDSITLAELWEDITYNDSEIFLAYGLDGYTNNVEVTPVLTFVLGRCYTLTPRQAVSTATRYSGYSVTLQHDPLDVATNTGRVPAGYHIYVHYSEEPFTEVEVYNGGLVDYLHVKTGETLDVKLTVDQYSKISTAEDPCWSSDHSYSTIDCTTRYVMDLVEEAANCSGPWMDSHLPPCRSYSEMMRLISSYINVYQSHKASSCPRRCDALLYHSSVTDRHYFTWDVRTHTLLPADPANLQVQLFVYFNGMMVSVYEERFNYDWTLFVADIGGSVGFLLGISVLSLIAYVSKACDVAASMAGQPAEARAQDTDSKEAEKFKEWTAWHPGNFM